MTQAISSIQNPNTYSSIFKSIPDINKPQKPLTLIFLIKKNSILLAMKKRGFGMGRWNGFGGKIEQGDASVVDGAFRELYEESNVKVLPPPLSIMKSELRNDLQAQNIPTDSLRCFGRIFFNFGPHLERTIFVTWLFYCFLPEEFEALVDEQIEETEEMLPNWFSFDEIPYERMWPDDSAWLPILLKKVQNEDWTSGFEAYFNFSETFDSFTEQTINHIEDGETYYKKELEKYPEGRVYI